MHRQLQMKRSRVDDQERLRNIVVGDCGGGQGSASSNNSPSGPGADCPCARPRKASGR